MNRLIIGNKNYSSWSLRPWLLLKEFKIPFKETRIALYEDESKQALLEHADSGKVPAFYHDDYVVWDSLAICETLNDLYPQENLWPQDPAAKALARSISHEMHSGFIEIRNQLPMNCRTQVTLPNINAPLQQDINRIREIWSLCRKTYQDKGDFLMGEFSICDAMFAPVVIRFNSYGIPLSDLENQYVRSILSLDSMQQWIDEGVIETERMPLNEVDSVLSTFSVKH